MGLLDRFTASPQERFAKEVVAELHRNGIPIAEYQPDRFAIRYATAPDDASGGQLFLHNVFAEGRDDSRKARRARVEHFVRNVTRAPKPPEGWEAVRPTLRPVLRSTFFGKLATRGEMKPLLFRPAVPHLNEYVVIDLPTTMSYVTLGDVATWGASGAEVFAAAHENLASRAPRRDGANHGIVKYVDMGDGYYASLPLLDGWLAAQAPEGGRAVAFIPDRASLLVLPDHPDAVNAMFDAAEKEYRESARGVSPQAYTTGADGRLVPYLGPEGHPVREAARRAEVIMSADEYGAQTELLSEQYEADGVDIFVAKVLVAEPQGGPIISATTWSQGIESLIPRAEYIVFVDSGQTPVRVRWDDVAAEVLLLPEDGFEPPRFRVGHWPAPDVMDRLRARAV
jgi:hypothetical protein